MLEFFLMTLLFLTAVFLIMLVLVQRGRGGGLAGAFGGLGGQSAFGTKAGDLFTRITIGVAAFWILLCAASVKLLSSNQDRVAPGLGAQRIKEENEAKKTAAEEVKDAGKAAPPGEKTNGKSAKSGPAPTTEKPAAAPSEKPAAETKPAAESKPAAEDASGSSAAAGGESKSAEPPTGEK